MDINPTYVSKIVRTYGTFRITKAKQELGNRHPAKKQSVSILGTGLDQFQHQCKENMEGILIGEESVGMPSEHC